MAPSSHDDDFNNGGIPPSDNPLAAFHRFINDQLSTAFESFISLSPLSNRADRWPHDSLHEAQSRPEIFDAPYEGPSRRMQDSASAKDAVTKFLNESYYSPFNLENDQHLAERGAVWRDAFGDLLRCTEGVPLPSRYPSRMNEHDWRQHYLGQWSSVLEQQARVQERGFGMPAGLLRLLLHDEIKSVQRILPDEVDESMNQNHYEYDCTNESDGGADQGPRTELDMYERMLTAGLTPPSSWAHDTMPAPRSQPEALSSRNESKSPQTSSLVSTLTTTETVTLPDGSVRTKRLLKKRFADGSEESNESEEIQAQKNTGSASRLQDARSRESREPLGAAEPESYRDNERKRTGWFWS